MAEMKPESGCRPEAGAGETPVYSPLISIIVPIYNAEAYLDKCIQSILQQDYMHFELLLIDDGSTDQSSKIIRRWKETDGRIRLFRKENGGQSSARNLGLDHAEGEYISFVDSDDYIAPDYLSYLLSLFDEQCRITACNHCVVRGNRQRANSESGDCVLTRKEAFEEVLFHGCIDVAPWGKLYRKEVFDSLRFPEGRIFEDTWLFGDILDQTEKIAFGHKCCYFYMIHDQSTVRKEYSTRNLQYIEAARKLAKDAERCSSSLQIAGLRRINHARLSVLRYMQHSKEKDVQQKLRNEVLRDSPQYINHPRTPRRDKIAVRLLKSGLPLFYLGWRLYEKAR